jgi:nitroreductase
MDEQADQIGLFDAIYHCRAMRRIKPDPVPEQLLLKLVEAAHQGPTAGNSQPGRWVIVRDRQQKQKLADLNCKAIERSYPAPPPNEPPSAFRWQYDHMQEIPALIIACVDRLAGRQENTFYAGVTVGGSIWPAVQNLLLAARGLGLGACPTTLPLSDRSAAKEVLGLPENIEPICLIPVGYPMGKFGPLTRRPLSEVVHWDRW